MHGPESVKHMMTTRIRVGIAESNDLLRDGLEALVRAADDLSWGGSWGDAASASRALQDAPVDVLLLDVRLPQGPAQTLPGGHRHHAGKTSHGGFHLLRELQTMTPSPRVIATVDCRPDDCVVMASRPARAIQEGLRVVSRPFAQPDDCLQLALKLGAHGVVHKHCPFSYLAQAIRNVAAGQYWMELPTAHRLAEQYLTLVQPSPPSPETGETLTLRERQIAALVAQGLSNKEIAHDLGLGYSTVKNHVSSVLQKLELRDRTQIALLRAEGGLSACVPSGAPPSDDD
jgi:DNA-binding NarL/FixJ family response regulator